MTIGQGDGESGTATAIAAGEATGEAAREHEPVPAPEAAPEPSLHDIIREKFPGEESHAAETSENTEAAEAPDPAAPAGDPATAAEAGTDEDERADLLRQLSDAELEQFQPKVRKRVQALLQDRAQHAARANTAEQQVQQLAPLRDAMTAAQLQGDEVQALLEIGALIKKRDYKTFLERLAPVIEHARVEAGQALPADIQQMVDDGDMTDKVAQEMSRLRSAHRTADMAARQTQEQQQQAAQQQASAARVAALRASFDSWEAEQTRANPDYAQLKPVITRYVQAEIAQRGWPSDEKGARQIADTALQAARADLAAFAPRRPATPPRPQITGAGATSASRPPETARDVALRVMRDARAAS